MRPDVGFRWYISKGYSLALEFLSNAMRHFYHNFVIGDDHNEGKKRMKKNKKEKEE